MVLINTSYPRPLANQKTFAPSWKIYHTRRELVLDNASIHKTKSVILTASRKGYHLLFIPPYTPEANPIELVFGIVKNSYYKARYCNGFSSVPLSVHQSVALLTQESVKNTFKHVPTAIGQLKGIQI